MDLNCDFNPERDTAILRSIKSLQTINGKPAAEFWKEVEEQRKGKKPITTFNDPAFKKWEEYVATLPAEEQVEAVIKKLQELNPGYSGNQTHQNNGNAVAELRLAIDNVRDISPLRALTELRSLHFTSPGPLADLGPLKGLKLTIFDCSESQVSDLSPLAGMPLISLRIMSTPVAELTPLRGMQLTFLNLRDTKVSDLSPLGGMPLTRLNCSGTQVSDLSPLSGTQLNHLQLSNTDVVDLSPLRGLPLQYLNMTSAKASDLTPLAKTPLETIYISDSGVHDLTPLGGMNLKSILFRPQMIVKGMDVLRKLNLESIQVLQSGHRSFQPQEFWQQYDAGAFDGAFVDVGEPVFLQWIEKVKALPAEEQLKEVVGSLQKFNPSFDGRHTPKIDHGVVTELRFSADRVRELAPLRALVGLTKLECSGTWGQKVSLSDLSPLAGMKLTSLTCSDTPVSDLAPLAGMPLEVLNCGDTKVSDLLALKGMPLTRLLFYSTQVSDLSPLKGMSLIQLNCGLTPVADLSPAAGMPLRILECHLSRVADLTPLQGMPLQVLHCSDTPATDLSPLKGTKLETILFTPKNIAQGVDIIRQMKSLKAIGVGLEVQR